MYKDGTTFSLEFWQEIASKIILFRMSFLLQIDKRHSMDNFDVNYKNIYFLYVIIHLIMSLTKGKLF